MNSAFWDRDVKTIMLGFSVANHSFTRPILDKLVGQRSSAWNKTTIKESFDTYMAGRTEFKVPEDIKTWSMRLLHQIHLNMEVTDEEVAEVIELQAAALGLIVLPRWTLKSATVIDLQDKRAKWLEKYMKAITNDDRGLFPSSMSNEQIFLIATSCLDSILFAGGLSVAGIISTAMSVVYSDNSPIHGQTLTKDGDVDKLVWETARHYPAVVGFPFYEGKQRHAVVISMTLRDPKVWGDDSDSFKLRSVEEYEKYGPVAFAQPSNGPGWREGTLTPMSRGCPGQHLSLAMATHLLGDWIASYKSSFTCENSSSIEFALTGVPAWTSSFKLKKK